MTGKIFLFLIPFFIYCETPFILFTVPKSGTHLAVKLFEELTEKKGELLYMPGHDFEKAYLPIFQQGRFFFYHYRDWKHLPYQDSLFKQSEIFLNVRDPRDVCVSSAFFFRKELNQILGETATFNERLAYVIQTEIVHDGIHDFFGPAIFFKKIFNLFHLYHPTLLLFEDLIGPKGGGSQEKQLAAIQKVAERIGVAISLEEMLKTGERIYGNSLTFRNGHIGSWKTHFTEEHKILFKGSFLNEALIRLGYEENSDW